MGFGNCNQRNGYLITYLRLFVWVGLAMGGEVLATGAGQFEYNQLVVKPVCVTDFSL